MLYWYDISWKQESSDSVSHLDSVAVSRVCCRNTGHRCYVVTECGPFAIERNHLKSQHTCRGASCFDPWLLHAGVDVITARLRYIESEDMVRGAFASVDTHQTPGWTGNDDACSESLTSITCVYDVEFVQELEHPKIHRIMYTDNPDRPSLTA